MTPNPGRGVTFPTHKRKAALVHFFKAKGLLLPRDYPDKFDGYSESWHSDQLSFSTCAEMLEALREWES